MPRCLDPNCDCNRCPKCRENPCACERNTLIQETTDFLNEDMDDYEAAHRAKYLLREWVKYAQ